MEDVVRVLAAGVRTHVAIPVGFGVRIFIPAFQVIVEAFLVASPPVQRLCVGLSNQFLIAKILHLLDKLEDVLVGVCVPPRALFQDIAAVLVALLTTGAVRPFCAFGFGTKPGVPPADVRRAFEHTVLADRFLTPVQFRIFRFDLMPDPTPASNRAWHGILLPPDHIVTKYPSIVDEGLRDPVGHHQAHSTFVFGVTPRVRVTVVEPEHAVRSEHAHDLHADQTKIFNMLFRGRLQTQFTIEGTALPTGAIG